MFARMWTSHDHRFVREAQLFAEQAHADQKRKYTGEPYTVHLAEVAELVKNFRGTPEMVAAAWLHDTVEDTGVTLREIEDQFGKEVAELVGWLTDVSKPSDGNRKVRKEIDRQHSAQASPAAKTIKLADLCSNCVDITKHDPNFARVYLREKNQLLDVLREGHSWLWKYAHGLLLEAVNELNMDIEVVALQEEKGIHS